MTGVVVLLVGVLLCFYGIRSVNLALLASGFAIGYLIADAVGGTGWTAVLVGLGAALLVWVVVTLVFRFATFVVGLATGAVIGAKFWSALANEGTSVLLGVVLVAAVAFLSAFLAEKYAKRMLLWLTALGGASIILSGLGILWPAVFDVLRHPDDGVEQTVMLLTWLVVAGLGWYVQRNLFRKQLGLPPKEPKQPATA
ncbi:hypothetical protein Cch01nite_37350 [Cellulomonas chitinilytica]|uniref:DUF4203 domain-containing protein n=1 Tax=Cellulomonas chitinilytica TaxID=398759 RepID=A0A919P7I4_9CELL|nr:DUF4203 domain-containing protein [Cellulomonas chitinilytica]GIG23011.1 hypothetical protein Cch01nite_37350 [Cellulomonas chitinilytica]